MEQYSRIERARRRGQAAKAGLGALTALVFGVAFVGARLHAPGHSTTVKTKTRAKALGVPSSFQRAVSSSLLQGGQIAPPVQAPAVQAPSVSSSSS